MKRREFIALLGGVTAMLRPVAARQQAPMRRVGILWPAASPPAPPRLEWFTQALRQLGFTEGHNLAIELRYAQQGLQQIPELAAELASMNVEVVAAFGDLAPKAMQQASKAVPIVAMADDILGAGIVTSLSRPGGNTTGVTVMAPEIRQKRLELLSEIAPGLRRAFSSPVGPLDRRTSQVSATERAAQALKLDLQILEVRRREDVIDAFRSAHTGAAEGSLSVFLRHSSSFCHPPEIIDLSAKYRLPAVYQWKEHVEARRA